MKTYFLYWFGLLLRLSKKSKATLLIIPLFATTEVLLVFQIIRFGELFETSTSDLNMVLTPLVSLVSLFFVRSLLAFFHPPLITYFCEKLALLLRRDMLSALIYNFDRFLNIADGSVFYDNLVRKVYSVTNGLLYLILVSVTNFMISICLIISAYDIDFFYGFILILSLALYVLGLRIIRRQITSNASVYNRAFEALTRYVYAFESNYFYLNFMKIGDKAVLKFDVVGNGLVRAAFRRAFLKGFPRFGLEIIGVFSFALIFVFSPELAAIVRFSDVLAFGYIAYRSVPLFTSLGKLVVELGLNKVNLKIISEIVC